MLSDPAAIAWQAAGAPMVDAPAVTEGRCGRCGELTATVSSTHIVSEKFTGFDAWPFGSRRLCVPCAWAYSHPPTTQPAMLITTHQVVVYADGRELAGELTNPLPATTAVLVPTAKRRHLLPIAQWGHLATDNWVLPWDTAAARRLTDLLWLRGQLGASWPQLSQPAPPPQLLRAQPHAEWERLLAAWSELQPWRSTPPMWAAARILTNRGGSGEFGAGLERSTPGA